jgi:hypothetical protein
MSEELHVGTRGRAESPTSFEMPSGTFVELLDPHPEDILLEDIAHNLAEEPRYGGTCSPRISVAQHAVLVARRLRKLGAHPATVLDGLHHDDPEAFLKDIPRPLKTAFEQLAPGMYKGLETAFAFKIRHALGLDVSVDGRSFTRGATAEISEADQWALGVEAMMAMPSGGKGWVQIRPQDHPQDLPAAHDAWASVQVPSAEIGAKMFLAEHQRCMTAARATAVAEDAAERAGR